MSTVFRVFATILFLVAAAPSAAPQTVGLQGRVNCPSRSEDRTDVRRARYVIIIPKNMAGFAVLTDPQGFFRLDLPRKLVLDGQIKLFCLGKLGPDQETATVFVSEDLIRDGAVQIPVPLEMRSVCLDMEFDVLEGEVALGDVREGKIPRSVAGGRGLGIDAGAGSTLLAAVLAGIGAVGAAAGPDGETSIRENHPLAEGSVSAKTVRDGRLLDWAYTAGSQNGGFAFAPVRNYDESVFWNLSSSLFAPRSQVGWSTNWKDYVRISSFWKGAERFGIGLGIFALFPKEERTVRLGSAEGTQKLHSTEIVTNLGFAFRAAGGFSLSLSPKFFFQRTERPESIDLVTYFKNDVPVRTDLELVTKEMQTSKLDLDLGATLRLSPSVRLGISLANAFGARTASDRDGDIRQRFLGVGVTYLRRRLNIGADVRLREGDRSDVSLGLNYVPLNKGLIHLGFCSRDSTLTFGLSYGNLSCSFHKAAGAGVSFLIGSRIAF